MGMQQIGRACLSDENISHIEDGYFLYSHTNQEDSMNLVCIIKTDYSSVTTAISSGAVITANITVTL